jgi:F-type H+-transporting ATPase subunit delta
MSVNRIASRYAKSLLDLAQEQGKLERVVEDMAAIKQATENRDLYMLLKSPIINEGKKKQVFDAIFGGKLDVVTTAFMDIILAKSREEFIPEIAEEFMLQYRTLKEVSTVTITTASPLSAAGLEEIRAKFLASHVTGKSVEIKTAIDPEILGGFIAEIGGQRYDASVKYRLEQVKKQFANNEYVKQL